VGNRPLHIRDHKDRLDTDDAAHPKPYESSLTSVAMSVIMNRA
jgi:hypothetical protein